MASVERTTIISNPAKKDDGSGLLLAFIVLAIGGLIFYVWTTGRGAHTNAPAIIAVEAPAPAPAQ